MKDEIIKLFASSNDFFKFAPNWLSVKDPNPYSTNTAPITIAHFDGSSVKLSLPRNIITDSVIELLSINLDLNKGNVEYDRYFKIYQNLVKNISIPEFILLDHFTLELAIHFVETDPDLFKHLPERFKIPEYYTSFIKVNKKVLKHLTNASEELIIETADTLLNVPYQTKSIIFSIINNNIDEMKYIKQDILSIGDWEYIKLKHFT